MNPLIEKLQTEYALSWKVTVNILGGAPDSAQAAKAAQTLRSSSLVKKLLSERNEKGKIPFHPYKKWNGAHWVLSILADLGYPAGGELAPLVEQSYEWLLGEAHRKYIREINSRTRRCASQEGYLVWYSLRLGLADGRTEELVNRLTKWQWPDGGWNCDKRPEASHSSFMESLIPLRALALYAQISGGKRISDSADRAAEIFLKRHLFKRQSDGQLMDKHFLRLCYPCYWHYNILFALVVMAEAGFISDPRCREALDFLESKRLPDGGFPAEETYSRTTRPELSGYSLVDWRGTSRKKMNPFVTADALYVLRAAGRG